MSGQQGQALVGVLVVMMLVLLLAGAVAVGTSTLVVSERRPDDAVAKDLTVQSVVAASVSHVANGAAGCTSASSTSLVPSGDDGDRGATRTSPSSTPAPASIVVSAPAFPEKLPNPTSVAQQVNVSVYCLRVPFVRDGPLTRQRPRAVQGSVPNSCWSADLPSALTGAAFWVFFDARWPDGGAAFVANGGQSQCPSPTNGKCLEPAGRAAPVTQIAISCSANSLTRVTNPALYIRSSSALTPSPVFVAAQDSASSAAYYLLAAGTGSGRDFEEGVVLARSTSLTLLSEEPLG
jgi:hypothetical protein